MKRFLQAIKAYRKYVFIVIALTFFDVMIDFYLPNLMSKIVNDGIITGNSNYIIRTGLRMLVVSVVAGISMVVSAYYSSKATMSFGRDVRNEVFSHISKFSLGEFNHIGTSSLITRTTNDINQMQQVFLMSLRMMIRAPLMLVGGLIMAISKNPSLSMVLGVAMPILVVLVLIVGRRGFPLFTRVQKELDRLNLVLREKLTGVRVIRAFNKVDFEKERFKEANYNLSMTSLKVDRTMLVLFPLINLVLNFTIIGILWFGSKQVDMGNMLIGDIIAFIQYVMLTMFSLIMFSAIFIVVPRALASSRRIEEVMKINPSIVDKKEAKDLEKIDRIEFKNVEFTYPQAENEVLSNINFSLTRGESLAIIGGTGSGKSTLVNLIPRFYDPTVGEILINNRNIKDYSQDSIRARIGFVPQKAVLFSGSIRENIQRGKENASLAEVEKAAEIAQAKDFIEGLEAGYNSVVAQGGGNFSGGQKQRLSIARALVRDGDLFIFDDSFSALDFKTDKKLRQALKTEMKDTMKVIVAQRVSTVVDADKILVLDDGKMVGLGRHNDLVESCEVYREIVNSQAFRGDGNE